MADRMHQYPMFPQNITPNPLQQPQIPQQSQQSQQADPQMISALSNPEHSRMWQQMNQLQNVYRQQQSGDLAASQINHQIQEFARGQALSHGQGQPIVQQIQQSFGLNAQRMNPPGPVFHAQANLSQLLMASGSNNVPMNTQQPMKAPFNMNPMMHPSLNNPGVSRQLKMLSQQEIARLQQSGLSAQHAPNQSNAAEMFASSPMQSSQDQMHGSPHPAAQPIGPPGANQGMMPGSQQQSVQKRLMTHSEFQDRRNYLLGMITHSETALAPLVHAVRNAGSVDPLMQQKISQLRIELNNRKEVYEKFMASYGALLTQQMANNTPPPNMMNHVAHSTPQQPQQPTVPNPQVPAGFVPAQANQSVAAQYNIPAAGNGPSPMPTQGQSTLNQQIPMAVTPIARPNTIPPRTGGTPHQVSGSQLAANMSPNMVNFTPPSGQKVPTPNQTRQSVGIMPLDKQRFESTYAQFCRGQNAPPGTRVQIGEGRAVDLHQLHVAVMREGGASSVTQRDMWAVIGGGLGFVQFPGNEPDPPRSGPGIAQQLHNTYEQYLQHFENAYILTVKNRTQTGSTQQSGHPMNPNPLSIANNVTPGMSANPTEMGPNPSRPVANPQQINQQQFIATALRYAHLTVQDMRNSRVPDQIISFVERHRSELVKACQQQWLIASARRNAEQEQQKNANAQGQLPNVPEQAPVGLPNAPRPHPTLGPNTMAGMPLGDAKVTNGSFVPENVAVAPNQPPPTNEQLQHAEIAINQWKHTFQQRSLPGMVTHPVPEEQRVAYNQVLEQLFKMTSELEGRLPLYFAVFKSEELLRKFVAIVMTVTRQRQLLAQASPHYIIPAPNLRNMQLQVHRLNEEFDNRFRAMKAPAVTAAGVHAHALKNSPSPLAVPQTQNTSQVAHPVPPGNGRSTSSNPSVLQQTHLQPPPSHPLQPPPPQSHPPQSHLPKKLFPTIPPSPSTQPAATSMASPTPPPAAATSSTPATSAPTPQTAVGSPQTPKSPPSKAASKTKVTARITRKPSTASKGPTTPEAAPSVVGVKRPPEEDISALTNVAPSEAEASNAPSPKKAKTEWEGETSETLLKQQQEVENIKTDEDASVFLDRMKELFAMTATDDEIHHDIASTLGQILAGVGQEPSDAAAAAVALSVHGAGDAGPPPTALSPHLGPANDAAFLEFIDFSSFTTLDDEDSDSKAPTPDLVPSSETNPSPESGSEGESLGSTGSPDKTKIEDTGDRSDPLRLGSLREIDGGESAYYQTDNWKWEGQMHALDQPWAIFTS